MRAPIRSQETFEDDGDKFSQENTTDTGPETKVRQELKEEADINSILQRAGVNPLQTRQPFYGEVDYTIDLQGAYRAVQAAADAYSRLPEHIKEQYPDWESVVQAVEAGKITGLDPTNGGKASVPDAGAKPAPIQPADGSGSTDGSGSNR